MLLNHSECYKMQIHDVPIKEACRYDSRKLIDLLTNVHARTHLLGGLLS